MFGVNVVLSGKEPVPADVGTKLGGLTYVIPCPSRKSPMTAITVPVTGEERQTPRDATGCAERARACP